MLPFKSESVARRRDRLDQGQQQCTCGGCEQQRLYRIVVGVADEGVGYVARDITNLTNGITSLIEERPCRFACGLDTAR